MEERTIPLQKKAESAIMQAVLDLSATTTDISNDFDYLEGPWLKMPPHLIHDIKAHSTDGGSVDFAKGLWKDSKSLAQAFPDTPTRFELFGSPHKILPDGRFSYKKRRQIIVVGLPVFGSRDRTSFVIVFRKKEIVFAPNNHKGCYGYNWCIWVPQHLRGPNYNKQRQLVLRIYFSAPGSVKARSKKRTIDESHESPVKRRRVILKISPGKLASLQLNTSATLMQGTSDGRNLNHADQEEPIDPSVHRASSQDLSGASTRVTADTSILDEIPLAPSTHLETPLEEGKHVTEADETIIVAIPPDTSAEHTNVGHEKVNAEEVTIEEESDALDSTLETHIEEVGAILPNEMTAVVQESTTTWANPSPDLVDDNTENQSPPESTTLSEPATNIDPFKLENVIVIEDDDDEPEVKNEVAGREYVHNPWQPGIPPPLYPAGIVHAHALIGSNPVETAQFVPLPLQNGMDASRYLYPNVRVEFLDAAGTVRDEKPFCRCASARDLFEAAMEADILEPNTRMFVVQVGVRQPTKMRFEEQESFREKLLGPLHQLLNHKDGASVTIRVHGFVYVRA